MPLDRVKLDAALAKADSIARGDSNDELTTVRKASPERGFKIPAPKDPKERAEYEAGVARRKAEGRGPFVGDR